MKKFNLFILYLVVITLKHHNQKKSKRQYIKFATCEQWANPPYEHLHERNSKAHITALEGNVYGSYYKNDDKSLSISDNLKSVKKEAMRNLFGTIATQTKICVNISLFVEIEREEVVKEHGIHLLKTDIMDSLDWDNDVHNDICNRFQEAHLQGSGWNFRRVIGIKMAVTKFQPLKGGSYIDLPDSIKA